MRHLDQYLDAEQVQTLRDFETPPPPPKSTRRKGTLRMAAIINTLREQGQTDFTVWDVLTRLRELDLVKDLWEWKGDDGAKKTVGDCVGGHGLKIPSAMVKREINGENKLVRVYQIPDGGITDAYCEQHLITLVDDPKEPDPEPVESGTVIEGINEGVTEDTTITAVDCE